MTRSGDSSLQSRARDARRSSHVAAVNVLLPFYRRYPYRGGLEFGRADARGALCRRSQFFFNRIPKNANSTVLDVLARQAAERGEDPRPLNPKRYFVRPSELTRDQARDLKSGAFKFVFVRNPFSRTLSAYLDKVRTRSRRRHHVWARRQGWETTPTFLEFCRFLADGGLREDPHWAPQADCLLLPPEHFDFMGRFEWLDDDLSHVVHRVFGATAPAISRAGPPSTGARDKLADHYCSEARAIVQRHFAVDFEMLGYDADNLHCTGLWRSRRG